MGPRNTWAGLLEKLNTDDWTLDGVQPDTIPNHLALGARSWNYDANVFYFSVRYTKGETPEK